MKDSNVLPLKHAQGMLQNCGMNSQEGEQLTIQAPDPEFEEILLASVWCLRTERGDEQRQCSRHFSQAAKLGKTLIGDDDEGTTYALDTAAP